MCKGPLKVAVVIKITIIFLPINSLRVCEVKCINVARRFYVVEFLFAWLLSLFNRRGCAYPTVI